MQIVERTYEVGTSVKGIYHGQPYRGVVTYARPHTMNQSYMHHIALDQPLTVYGATRSPGECIIVAVWEPTPKGNTIEAAA